MPASFRGVAFYCDATDGEIGRRVALHEYPLRDLPYAEDLGRKARRYTLDGYVLGVDYMAARDALIAAIEAAGPGILVHPYLGQMSVTVLEARGPRESTAEGGMARFSLTFVESGEALFPTAVTDTTEAVAAAADDTWEVLAGEFSEVFDVTSRPAWVAAAAASLMDTLVSALAEVQDLIPSVPQAAVDFVADLETLSAGIETLIRAPQDLAMQVMGLVQQVALLPDRPLRALSAYRSLWDVLSDTPEVPGDTGNRSQQAANQQALIALVQRVALVESVRTAATVEYTSAQEAMTLRDELGDRLDAVMESASDTVYNVMVPLRAAMVRDMADRAVRLPRLVTVTPAITLPALVLAYRFYGDAGRASEIVARNGIRHPGFVTGGRALEVLADA